MSKKILELSTKKSLYKPIIIRVDGKEYESAMITAELFDKVMKLDKKAKKGDLLMVAKQLELIYGVPIEIGKKLDLRDMGTDAIGMLTEAIIKPEKIEKQQENGDSKNGAGPGEKGSAKSRPNSQASRSKNLSV